MLNTKLMRTALACILVVVLMLSLFCVSVFAEETDDATADTTVDTTEDSTEATDDAATDDTTTTGDAADKDHDHDHDHETEAEEEKKGLTTGDIISLAVLGVAIIAVVIYCLTHKEKVGKFFRSIKSEYKKISWTPWTQVRKNTIVVLIVVISIGLLIAGLDFVFSKGIYALGRLF